MSDLLHPAEVNDLFEGLAEAADKIFGGRLCLPNFTEHHLSTSTATERYDINYYAGNVGAASLDGLLTIVEWVPTGDGVAPNIEDTESEYGSETFLVDRNTYGFNLGNRSYSKSYDVLKCILGEDELYEPVEETSITYTRGMGEENLDDLALSELVDIDTISVSRQDREAVARVFSMHGVLIF